MRDTFADLSAWTASAGCSSTSLSWATARALKLAKSVAGTQESATRACSLPAASGMWEWWIYVPTSMQVKISLLAGSTEVASCYFNAGTLTWAIDGATVATTTYTQAAYRHYTIRLYPDGTGRLFTMPHSSTSPGSDDFPPLGNKTTWPSATVDTIKVETLGSATGNVLFGQLVAHAGLYVAEGDSITAGHGVEYDPNPAYAALDSLASIWAEEGAWTVKVGTTLGSWITNRGVGSSSIGNRSSRFTNVLALAPSWMIIGPPVAAILLGDSLSTLQTVVGGWITSCTNAGVGVVLCEATPSSSGSYNNTTKTGYNSWIAGRANGSTVLVAAMHDAVASTPGATTLATAYSYDGTHINAAGNTKLADALGAVLPAPGLTAVVHSDHVSLSWLDYAVGESAWYVERRVT